MSFTRPPGDVHQHHEEETMQKRGPRERAGFAIAGKPFPWLVRGFAIGAATGVLYKATTVFLLPLVGDTPALLLAAAVFVAFAYPSQRYWSPGYSWAGFGCLWAGIVAGHLLYYSLAALLSLVAA